MAELRKTLREHRQSRAAVLADLARGLAQNLTIIAKECDKVSEDPDHRLHLAEQESYINTVYFQFLQVLGSAILLQSLGRSDRSDLAQILGGKVRSALDGTSDLSNHFGRMHMLIATANASRRTLPDLSKVMERIATEFKACQKDLGAIWFLESIGVRDTRSRLMRRRRER